MLIYLSMLDNPDDKAKFEGLYNRYKWLMYSVANAVLHNSDDTEDVLHDVFIKVTKNIEKIGEIDCPKTRNYLVIITRTTAIDFITVKKKKECLSFDDIEDFITSNVLCEELVESDEAVEELSELILALPEKYMNALFLKLDNGLSNKEIAKELNISLENAYKIINRAKKMLEKKLDKKDLHEKELPVKNSENVEEENDDTR